MREESGGSSVSCKEDEGEGKCELQFFSVPFLLFGKGVFGNHKFTFEGSIFKYRKIDVYCVQ